MLMMPRSVFESRPMVTAKLVNCLVSCVGVQGVLFRHALAVLLLLLTPCCVVEALPSNTSAGGAEARYDVTHANCVNGSPHRSSNDRGVLLNVLHYLIPGPKKSNRAGQEGTKSYEQQARNQCECYEKGSQRVRPPILADNNIALEKVFLAEHSLPAFSSDETFLIISAHVSLVRKSVVVVVGDHLDGEYRVTESQQAHMKHGSDEVDVYCNFIDHRDGNHSEQKMYGPVKISGHNDHHIRTISCQLPDSVRECLGSGTGAFQKPKCVDVSLVTKARGETESMAYTVALLQVCQFERPQRQDFLAMCTQPMDSGAFPQVVPWVEYHHRSMGVDRFYLYVENRGLDALVEPYARPGVAEVRYWMDPRKGNNAAWLVTNRPLSQTAAMHDCLYRLTDHARWIAFFDVDEYVHPLQHASLPPFLSPHTGNADVGSLRLSPWQYDRKEPDDGSEMLMVANYKRHKDVADKERSKVIVQSANAHMLSIHAVLLGQPEKVVSERELYFNHYRDMRMGPSDVDDDGMRKVAGELALSMQKRFARMVPQ